MSQSPSEININTPITAGKGRKSRKSNTQPSSNGKSRGPKTAWNDDDDRKLIDALKEAKAAGSQADNSWKTTSWNAAAKALEGSEKRPGGGAPKTADSCSYRFAALKKAYAVVKAMLDKSGFGYNEETGTVVAPDQVWEEYLAKVPAAAKWRKKAFPLYDDIADLVEGRQANGEGAFRAGQSSDSEEGDEEPIEWPPSDREPDTPSTPPPVTPIRPSGRKRAASGSDDITHTSKRDKRQSNAQAIRRVGDALEGLGDAFKNTDPSTPMRRKKAVEALVQNNELSPMGLVKAIGLVEQDVAFADTYCSITRDDIRALYVQERIKNIL